MKRKLRQSTVYLLYGVGFVLLVTLSFTLEGFFSKKTLKEDIKHVSDTSISRKKVTPVVSESKIIRPYNDSDIKILLNYYDYKGEDEKQKESLIVYENTYMQSSGVTYGGKDNFDVIAVLDGKVTNVKEDELLGNIIEITHDNGIISIYQSLSEVKVKLNDQIKQGTIIGKSGTCKVNSNLGSNLYFELIVNGNLVDPELYYDKQISEI